MDCDKTGQLIISKNPFNEGVFETNDAVELKSHTDFKWLGRLDNVINSGGVKIHPEELEKKLGKYLHGRRLYFSSENHPELGQRVVLAIEGTAHENEDELFRVIESELASYERPKRIIYLREFDETPSGKVIRKKF